MRSYSEIIASARLITDVKTESTSGDLEYSGTALEVGDQDGVELFHVVVDEKGERQLLFFSSERDYRMPLELLERLLSRAKKVVREVDVE